jgi:hypothetical protein
MMLLQQYLRWLLFCLSFYLFRKTINRQELRWPLRLKQLAKSRISRHLNFCLLVPADLVVQDLQEVEPVEPPPCWLQDKLHLTSLVRLDYYTGKAGLELH